MATIQNDRDKLLQAASVRFVLPTIDPVQIPGLQDAMDNANSAFEASKFLRIRANTSVFKIGFGGASNPASATLEAVLSSNLSGIASWSVVNGNATLSGSGNTRTLTASNLTSLSATIRATLVSGGRTFQDEWTITKVADGANGTNGSNGSPGANGTRGTVTVFYVFPSLVRYPNRSGTAAKWASNAQSPAGGASADSWATDAVTSRHGAGLVQGDSVVMTNSATSATVTVTGYWNGSSWTNPGTVIDGNLLVGGDIAGQSFTGGTFTGTRFQTAISGARIDLTASTSTFSIYDGSGSRRVKLESSSSDFNSFSSQPALEVTNYFTGSWSNDSHAIRATANKGVAVGGTSTANYSGFFVSKSSAHAAVFANGTYGADGLHATGTKYGIVASGTKGAIRLLPGYTEDALPGTMMATSEMLYFKTATTGWRAVAFV